MKTRSARAVFLALAALLAVFQSAPSAPKGEPVVLLHGLALSPLSLKKITDGLRAAGYRACPVDYPSRHYSIDTLAARFILPAIARCFPGEAGPIHFVTHSMGGILARELETLANAPRIGRVVMIAPPNHGSEVVDKLGGWKLFGAWNGPAGKELGTDSGSVPRRLGSPAFEFGVIAGARSLEPLFSDWIPGRDDGKVAVESAKLRGMRDFIEIPASHTLILWKDETLRQVLAFLRDGKFARP